MNIIQMNWLTNFDIGLSTNMAKYMEECTRYCLTSQNHQPGVIMFVKTNDNIIEEFEIKWEELDDKNLKYSMQDEERTTDFGAMGLSLILALNLTHYKYFVTSSKGTGFDFWLFEEEPEDLDFTRASARLEISGIRKANQNNSIVRRLGIKKQQIRASDQLSLLAYISIVEFNRPESIFLWQ